MALAILPRDIESLRPPAPAWWRPVAAQSLGHVGEALAHGGRIERLLAVRAEQLREMRGWILPSMTLQSVTASGPPRR
jgi:hypothetical protein